MNKANDLKTITDIVHDVLLTYEQARNSDNFLFLKVCEIVGTKNGIDINSMSIPTFFLHLKEYGFPQFESVRRSRQKLQATYPDLCGCCEVEAHRTLNEEVFRDYARSVVIR